MPTILYRIGLLVLNLGLDIHQENSSAIIVGCRVYNWVANSNPVATTVFDCNLFPVFASSAKGLWPDHTKYESRSNINSAWSLVGSFHCPITFLSLHTSMLPTTLTINEIKFYWFISLTLQPLPSPAACLTSSLITSYSLPHSCITFFTE